MTFSNLNGGLNICFFINKNDNRRIKNDTNTYKDDMKGDENRWEMSIRIRSWSMKAGIVIRPRAENRHEVKIYSLNDEVSLFASLIQLWGHWWPSLSSPEQPEVLTVPVLEKQTQILPFVGPQ